MGRARTVAGGAVCCFVLGVPLWAAAPLKSAGPAAQVTTTPERLDLQMYARIREEGLNHSRVMEYASALDDAIGPRLTGSPEMAKANAWTRDTLAAMGCTDAHLEDWGEFGMGWEQEASSLRMVGPEPAVFIAQAAPWSPATTGADGKPGPVRGEAVVVTIDFGKNARPVEQQMADYKGKLRGRIVLLGDTRPVGELDTAPAKRFTDEELAKLKQVPLGPPDDEAQTREYFSKVLPEKEKLGRMLADEGAAAVIVPSRDSRTHGGQGGTIFDDSNANFSWFSYQRAHATPVPLLVASIENYGRVTRLLAAHVPVELEANVDVRFTGDHEHGFDTIAEIAGTDPALKEQVVMLGGHLESWAGGTGATDNGAGTVVAMEVMRILTALNVRPRRTIRIGLWSGEEEGIFGSAGYVAQHFGTVPLAGDASVPDFLRDPSGPPVVKPEQARISAYYNLDYGHGRIRGIDTQGNVADAPIFEQWIAPLGDLGVSTVSNASLGSTDHLSFDAVGIPGFQFIQDPLDYGTRTHHSNMDVWEALRPEDLRQAAVVEATFVYNTAMRDAMLPRKSPGAEFGERKALALPGSVAK